MSLLLWAKGPGFALAAVLFLLGTAMRLAEILRLGRGTDLARPRGAAGGQALRTVFSRFLPAPGLFARSPVVHAGGYVFHIGLLVVVIGYGPHLAVLGIGGRGLPAGLIDGVTLLTMAAMTALLAARLRDPVKRLISGPGDYGAWGLVFLPLATGFLLVNRVLLPFEPLLALHLLSVEVMLALLPFTKLVHAFTFVLARGYAGAIAGRKGAHS